MPNFMLYLVLSCLTCLAIISAPSLMFILAIIWGIILILTGLETNKRQLTIIFAVNLVLLWFLSGDAYLLYIGLPSLAMGVKAVDKNSGYYDLLKIGLLTAVAAGTLLLGVFYISGDTGINQIEPQINDYVRESLEVYEDSGLFELEGGINRGEFESSIYQVVHTMVRHLPALYFLQAVLIIVLTLYLASRVARRRGINRLQKQPFIREQMPWQIAWLVIAGLGLWLIGNNESTTRLIGSNLLAVMTPVLAYFGLSVLAYKLKRLARPKKTVITALVVVTGIILTLPAIIFLTLLGLFDSLIDYRKLRTDKEVPL